MDISNYREHPFLSQSELKTYSGFGMPKKRNEKVFDKGNLVDCLCTTPEIFDDFYLISDIKKPSESIVKVVDWVFGHIYGDYQSLDNYRTIILLACEEFEVYQKMKPDTVFDKVVKEGTAYYDYVRKAGGLTVLGQDEYELAVKMSNVLKTHSLTKNYFVPEDMLIDIKFQTPVYGNYYGVDMKGLLDIVILDMSEQTYRVVDVKSTYDLSQLTNSVDKFRYDIQLEVYNTLFGNQYPNLRALPPRIIAVDSFRDFPVVLEFQSLLTRGRFGGKDKYGSFIPGTFQLLEAYKKGITYFEDEAMKPIIL